MGEAVNSCPETGKRCFGSAQAARRASRKVHNKLRVYRCPFCHCLHITSRAKPEKGRING